MSDSIFACFHVFISNMFYSMVECQNVVLRQIMQ